MRRGVHSGATEGERRSRKEFRRKRREGRVGITDRGAGRCNGIKTTPQARDAAECSWKKGGARWMDEKQKMHSMPCATLVLRDLFRRKARCTTAITITASPHHISCVRTRAYVTGAMSVKLQESKKKTRCVDSPLPERGSTENYRGSQAALILCRVRVRACARLSRHRFRPVVLRPLTHTHASSRTHMNAERREGIG